MIGEIHNQKSLHRWNGPQRRIGITGGIASGKSSVGKYLKEIKGFPILDADLYAHNALAPGKTPTRVILERYGNAVAGQIQNHQPSINRSALSKIIFSDPNERLWIEELIHPIVHMHFTKELERMKNSPVIVLIVPLLFEAGFNNLCSEVWVINCTTDQQCLRLQKREGISSDEALKRVQSQWPLQEKIGLADVVIDNQGDFQKWIAKVNQLC